MQDFQKRKRIRKILYSKITLAVVVVIFVLFARAAYQAHLSEKSSADYLEKVNQRFVQLDQRKNELSSGIEKLGTEQGVEDEIRSKFDVSKDGEKIAVIVDSKDDLNNNKPENKSFFGSIADFFKKIF